MKLFLFAFFVLASSHCARSLALRSPHTPEAKQWFGRVQAAENARRALGGAGNVTLKRNGVPLKASLSLSAGPEGRVRLDVSTDAGNVLLAFAANPERLFLIDFEHRRFMATPTGPNDLAALSVPEIDARALASLLLSHVPCEGPPSGADATHLAFEGCLGGTLLATFVQSPDGSPLLRELKLERGKDTAFSARLLSHTTLGFARRIEITTQATDLLVQLDEIDANPPLDEDIFTLAPPPGVSIQEMHR